MKSFKLFTLVFCIIIHFASPSESKAESKLNWFAGPKVGFHFFKPTDLSLSAGINLGLEGGYRLGNLGNLIFNFNTSSFDQDSQMNHYLIGFSREVIWGVVASVSVGLQSIFDREIETGVSRISSPTGSSFAYGVGVSYQTDPVLIFRNDINLQIMPEISYYKGSVVNWYGATLGFRFNFLTAEQPASKE